MPQPPNRKRFDDWPKVATGRGQMIPDFAATWLTIPFDNSGFFKVP
jgi:hypothetical protein